MTTRTRASTTVATTQAAPRGTESLRAGATPAPDALQDLYAGVGNAAFGRMLQARRSAAGEGVAPVSPKTQLRIDGERGKGRALDGQTRSEMEALVGADLSGVRLHEGPSAAGLAGALGARAFTQGRQVFMGAHAGSVTLVHELTHAAQDRARPGTVQREPADPA